ncbi:MAG: hypothetical protein ACTHMX_16720 [Thermomicrobiales bacterium]
MTDKSLQNDPFAFPAPDSPADGSPAVEYHTIAANPPFANNPRLPVLVYRNGVALDSDDPGSAMEDHFQRNGWGYSWRNGIFNYHHFHSTAHEVLGVAAGTATVELGGPGGPRVEMQAGDVIVIPVGVALRNIGSSPDLIAVGAYPPGQVWDLNTGDADEHPRVERNIDRVALPTTDPVLGPDGPLLTHWGIAPA